MMNTDQINAYLEKLHANDVNTDETKTPEAETAPANAEETKVQEDVTATAPEEKTKENAGSETEDKAQEEAQPAETEPDDKVDENKKEKPTISKKHTKQEQIDYAFQKEKAKRKKLENRIKELEEENKKYRGLKLEDFKNSQEDYINYLVEQKARETEKKRLENEYVNSKNQEAEQINKQRIVNCFPDESEQTKYNELVAKNGADFVKILDEADPEQVVLGYLDDSEISPLLIRIMMTNKEYRNEVLSKSSPYGKQRAMEKLEQKVLWARQQLEARNKQKKEKEKTATEQKKPSIPVVGSVTQSESSGGKVIKDYNSVLRELNNKRKYQQS